MEEWSQVELWKQALFNPIIRIRVRPKGSLFSNGRWCLMPKERKKVLCMDAQRHAEYYGMQPVLIELYHRSWGENFTGLMDLILSRTTSSGISEHQSKRRKLHSRNRQQKHQWHRVFTARNSCRESEVYCHRKSARIPPKAGKTQRHSETKTEKPDR